MSPRHEVLQMDMSPERKVLQLAALLTGQLQVVGEEEEEGG